MARYRIDLPAPLQEALAGHSLLGRKKVFKFHHAQDSKYFSSAPSLKIGTMVGYQTAEKTTIADEREGREIIGFPDEYPTTLGDVDPRYQMHNWLVGGGNASIQGITISTPAINGYIFCFSYSNSASVVESFNDDVPYDAVAVCNDIYALADFICRKHPQLKGSRYICAPVIYRDTMRSPDDPYVPPIVRAFEKERDFSNNLEGRIYFIPPKPPEVFETLYWNDERLSRFWKLGVTASGR